MIFYNEKFRSIRRQLGRSATHLARQCDVRRETIHRWESGSSIPSADHVKTVCKALNISTSEISDIPDTNLSMHNSILGKMKSFKSLSEATSQELKAKEDEFISEIIRQRRETEDASLVINALLKAMHSAFYVKNLENKYVVANQAFANIIGEPFIPELEGKTDFDFFPHNEADQNAKIDQNVIEQKAKVISEQMYIPGTRKKRWGMVTKVPIINHMKIAEGMLCTIKDITEEKNANELNLELRTAISKIQDVVWTGRIVDYKLKYTTVNEATNTLLGITQEQFLRDEWKKYVHPDFLEDIRKKLKTSGSNSRQIEYRYIHPVTGKNLWLQNSINVDGQYYFGVIRDITTIQQQQIEKEYLLKCLSSMDSMFWAAELVDKEKNFFKYLTISKGLEKIFEESKSKLEKDSTIWKKRLNPKNIHSKEKNSYEVDYVLQKDNHENDKWIHEVIHKEGNMLFGLTIDITRSSLMDKGNKKLLEKAIDEISHGVILLSHDKKQCFYANNSAAQIFGVKKNAFAKSDINNLIFNNLKYEENEDCGQEKYCIAKYSICDKEKWLEIVEKPFSFYEMECTLLMAKDITIEKGLKNLQKLLLQSFKNFNIGFSIKEASSMKVLFDISANEIFGISPDIPLDKTRDYWVNNIVHADDRLREKMYFKNRNWPEYRKYRIIHPKKGLRWIEARHSFFTNNNIKYMISFMADITELEDANK